MSCVTSQRTNHKTINLILYSILDVFRNINHPITLQVITNQSDKRYVQKSSTFNPTHSPLKAFVATDFHFSGSRWNWWTQFEDFYITFTLNLSHIWRSFKMLKGWREYGVQFCRIWFLNIIENDCTNIGKYNIINIQWYL